MFENLSISKELIPNDPRFGCGPSLVSTKALNDLASTGVSLLGTSHRKPKVKNLVKEVQEGLANYFDLTDHEIILGNGGATFLWDMIALGMVEKSSKHHVCGEFSNKWYKAHSQVPWLETSLENVEYGQGLIPSTDESCDLIALTLNETSTGVQMTGVPSSNDKTLICMDATSGAGQIECDHKNVDFYYFSPQKVFAAEGGLFIGFLSEKAKDRAMKINSDKNRYIPTIMNWKLAIDNSAKNQTYNTPSVSNLFLLNEQIKEMNKLGRSKVNEMAELKAQHIYSWAESKPYLSCFVKDDSYRSRSVATIDVDEKITVTDLSQKLSDLNIANGIDSYRKLGRNQFRISLFHNITLEDLEKLTALLSYSIESTL